MPSDENITKKYLHEWFLENDNLVIPDLGRFEASYLGAKLHPAAHKALPPNKTLFFDPLQKEDDQVLANFIAEQENTSLSEAQKLVKLFVTTVKAELGIQKKYTVESLGTFIWNPGGSIGFQPDEELNYLGDSFGLPDLYNLKPGNFVAQETINSNYESNFNNTLTDTKTDDGNDNGEVVFESSYDDKDYVEEPADDITTDSRSRVFRFAAIFLLLLSVATIYFLVSDQNLLGFFKGSSSEEVVENNSDEENEESPIGETQLFEFEGDGIVEADENANNSDENEEEEETTNNEPNEEESPRNNDNTTEEVDYSNYDGSKVVDYATNDNFIQSFAYNPTPPSNVNSIMVKQKSSRFYVVLGSFSKVANAYSFYNNLVNRGVSTAKIISPSGGNVYYRVSSQDYATLKEAETKGKAFGKQRNLFVLIYPY